MKLFAFIKAVFKSYQYSDKLISLVAFAVIVLMIVKMIIFPYGFFGFGESDIYTEGLVAKNGVQNINPLFTDYNEADREVSRLVFSGLMKYDPEKKAVVEDMATLTVNEEKTEYTFTLRNGLKWHDGEPVTADDVYFTFHDVIENEGFPNEILRTNFDGVEIKKLDERTVQFILKKPNTFFVTNFITGLLPYHKLKNVDPADLLQNEFNRTPIGTGPYMVTEPAETFAGGRMQITLEQNPYYYGEKSEIELMRFIVFPTMEELLEQINSVNAVVKISGKYILDFQNNKRFELMPYKLPQYTAVFMNMDTPIIKDGKAVRVALQKALDRDALVEAMTDKIVVYTPLLELDQKNWAEKPDAQVAQEGLYEAGYRYGPSDTEHVGIRYDSDGNALELNLIARLYDEGSEQYEETAKVVSFLSDAWEAIGFAIRVELLPQDLFKERIMNRSYDLLLVGQSLGYNLDTYSYWHSTQASIGGQNFSDYKSFRVDSLIENVRATFDPGKRDSLLMELAQQIKDDVPAIFLYRPAYYYATDGKVSGVSLEGVVFPSDRFAGISLWKFER